MSGTGRDCWEVGGFLSHSPGAHGVRVGSFDSSGAAGHLLTDCASKRPNPSQIIRASVRTRRGRDRIFRTGTCRFGARPRGNGTLRRNGTRLLSTITSIFNWRTSAQPRTPQWHPAPAFCVYGGGTEGRDRGPRPP